MSLNCKMFRFLVFLTSIVLIANKGCEACFGYNLNQHVSIKTGTTYYQECRCLEPGYTVENIKWLDIDNKEINTLRPDMFTEVRDRSIGLHIRNVSKTMTGEYKCITEFNGKQYTWNYEIKPYDPLYFYETEEKQFLIQGQDKEIICKARGESNPIISWYVGPEETKITNEDKYEFTINGLKVKNVTSQDTGMYKCTAAVPLTGEEMEKYINVEVTIIPVIEEIYFNPNSTVVVGETVSLECIADGIPEPRYIWSKIVEIGTPVEENNTWIQDKNTIRFENITANDNGLYECIAINDVGEARQYVNITVLFSPTITEFRNITALEGSITKNSCKASGRSTPAIKITFEAEGPNEDTSITWESKKTNSTASELNVTFLKVNKSHSGRYICNATNEVDYDTAEMYLSVLYKPYFKDQTENIWGWSEKIVDLNCEHDSNPPANLTWRFQGVDVTDDKQTEINKLLSSRTNKSQENHMYLNVSDTDMFGIYECLLSNELGETLKTMTLRKGLPPLSIKNVLIRDSTATSVNFDIAGPDYVEGPPVVGYTVQYDEAHSYKFSDIHINRTWSIDRPFKLNKLQPNTTYSIKFAALNEVGVGLWTEPITFTTKEKSVPERLIWDTDSETDLPMMHKEVLRWKTPEPNGDPIDYYLLRYCPVVKGDIQPKLCKDERIAPTTELHLEQLEYNRTYYLELKAHNSEGFSDPVDTYITRQKSGTPEEEKPVLSSGAIIGLSISAIFICLLALDLLMLACERKGFIAKYCCRHNNKKKKDTLGSRDKKGLLRDNGEYSDDPLKRPSSAHKEYEYNKTTGAITGKHSAV